MSNRPYSFKFGPGRRSNTFTNTERDEIEMQQLTTSTIKTNKSSRSPTMMQQATPSVQKLIDRLKSNKPWDDRFKFSKRERKSHRSQFAVDIPTRMIFHLIIIFFLIPLILGMMLLIRALFFGLKEDDEHPLHKKIPKSHLRMDNSSNSNENVIDIGDDHMNNRGVDDNHINVLLNETLYVNNTDVHNNREIDQHNNAYNSQYDFIKNPSSNVTTTSNIHNLPDSKHLETQNITGNNHFV